MEPVFWIDYFSIPFLFVFTLMLVVGSILLGKLLGFLAFLLAFTFNMATKLLSHCISEMMTTLEK